MLAALTLLVVPVWVPRVIASWKVEAVQLIAEVENVALPDWAKLRLPRSMVPKRKVPQAALVTVRVSLAVPPSGQPGRLGVALDPDGDQRRGELVAGGVGGGGSQVVEPVADRAGGPAGLVGRAGRGADGGPGAGAAGGAFEHHRGDARGGPGGTVGRVGADGDGDGAGQAGPRRPGR